MSFLNILCVFIILSIINNTYFRNMEKTCFFLPIGSVNLRRWPATTFETSVLGAAAATFSRSGRPPAEPSLKLHAAALSHSSHSHRISQVIPHADLAIRLQKQSCHIYIYADVFNTLASPTSTGTFYELPTCIFCVCFRELHLLPWIANIFTFFENTKYTRNAILRRMATEFRAELTY